MENLSEFNILYGDQPYLIDMGQSVTRDHPRAYPVSDEGYPQYQQVF